MTKQTLQNLRSFVAGVQRLAQMDPQDEAVAETVQGLEAQAKLIGEQEREAEAGSFGKGTMGDDVDRIHSQIDTLKAAAAPAARNYARVMAILGGLKRAAQAAERPQYAALRPRLAAVVEKVAGIFAEVDTVADLDKPLEQIEKAVHALYGDQSVNATMYPHRRGKGHSSEKSE